MEKQRENRKLGSVIIGQESLCSLSSMLSRITSKEIMDRFQCKLSSIEMELVVQLCKSIALDLKAHLDSLVRQFNHFRKVTILTCFMFS